ncbi:MAG: 3-dehydroquinate synthase [Muribaculaceae bacterium]|nr:3-dehydroquinate synthase [Muribaculaceae bacterium]
MRMGQNLIFTNDVAGALQRLTAADSHNMTVLVADVNTARFALGHGRLIVIPDGDTGKSLETVCRMWDEMERMGVTRQSLVVNLGGGMVCDLGGFAAATFKRGVRFINVPTTLLGAVDAAVGGKTGFNYHGLKNEIGAFAPASDVIISTCFFDTLPLTEMKSGFAEVLKHAMLSDRSEFLRLLDHDFTAPINHDDLLERLRRSVQVKVDIVARDPKEQGERKALNLGHTVGHAFESLAMKRGKPVPHGYAVAWGLVTEAVLSHLLLKFPSEDVHLLGNFVRDNYRDFPFTCDDYDELLDLMRHDKKSRDGEITCTLLTAIGDYHIDQTVTPDDVITALDILRDHLGM